MTQPLLESLTLTADVGLQCIDACTGQVLVHGLRCSVVNRITGVVLAKSISTPSGFHHWPDLPSRWQDIAPPSPLHFMQLEVLIEDLADRCLPMRMSWPLPVTTTTNGARLYRIELPSAPQRQAPMGSASLFAQLVNQHDEPAAWARVTIETSSGRQIMGMSDAQGHLAIHLAFPRPHRQAPAGSPLSPLQPPPQPHALATLRWFYTPALGVDALEAARHLPNQLTAPRYADWLAQPEVMAQEHAASVDPLAAIRFDVGQPCILRTAGLGLHRSELRLVPL